MILERLIALNARQTKEQTRAFIKECPLQDYDKLTQSPRLKQMAERINGTDDDEQQRKLKSWLPFRCPHYTQFRDDYRDREHIVAESFTWQTCIDIDDPELVEKANEMSEKLDIEIGGRWQGLMLHKDYSIRRKLHIDIRLPMGMTVPEAQREYCKALGVECDTSCFTPERFIYISPADFEIYRADGWYAQLSDEEVAARRKAYTDRGLSIDGRTEDGSYNDPQGPIIRLITLQPKKVTVLIRVIRAKINTLQSSRACLIPLLYVSTGAELEVNLQRVSAINDCTSWRLISEPSVIIQRSGCWR